MYRYMQDHLLYERDNNGSFDRIETSFFLSVVKRWVRLLFNKLGSEALSGDYNFDMLFKWTAYQNWHLG